MRRSPVCGSVVHAAVTLTAASAATVAILLENFMMIPFPCLAPGALATPLAVRFDGGENRPASPLFRMRTECRVTAMLWE
jgi:hypothetical protein